MAGATGPRRGCVAARRSGPRSRPRRRPPRARRRRPWRVRGRQLHPSACRPPIGGTLPRRAPRPPCNRVSRARLAGMTTLQSGTLDEIVVESLAIADIDSAAIFRIGASGSLELVAAAGIEGAPLDGLVAAVQNP